MQPLPRLTIEGHYFFASPVTADLELRISKADT